MVTSKVAKRYAQGFLEYANDSNGVDTAYSEMKDLSDIMKESKELSRFFATPFIDYKKKISVASEVFKTFSSASKNLIYLVIKQGRESELMNIAKEFINKVEENKGIQRVHLTVAKELTADNINKILSSTDLINPSNCKVTTQINPDILGGYIIRVGDQQIDASIKTKLNKLRKDFQVN